MNDALPLHFNQSAPELDLAAPSAKLDGMAKDSAAFRYADLFAGIGGFHAMLDHAGGRCVYVSEIDSEARRTYLRNWVDPLPAPLRPMVNTDITVAAPPIGPVHVPPHDVLAAGFPCQPFSKSGKQLGMDEARGTLFWNIARILQDHTPAVVLLENVRNIAGPRHIHEWNVIIHTLREIGYRVSSKASVFSPHFLPPSLGGTPQVRDRVFILGTYVGPGEASQVEVPPTVVRGPVEGWNVHDWDVDWVLDDDADIHDLGKYQLTNDETTWVNVWDDLVQRMWASRGVRLPGFPLWADAWIPERSLDPLELHALPRWKSAILIKNARFYDEHRDVIHDWKRANRQFASFPESRRKLEWQAQDIGSLWETILQFRPSGIRAKAPSYVPALVAITQTSVVGGLRRRRLTPHEAARLQGLPRSFSFGGQPDSASYKQVGNGVAVGAAWHVFRTHVAKNQNDLPISLVESVLGAAESPLTDSLSQDALAAELTDATQSPSARMSA